MKVFARRGISRKYAAKAAMYRRLARKQCPAAALDFSESALREFHAYESRGVGAPSKARNGYAYGKWARDLSVAMWAEDIAAGNACRAEFLQTAIERIHNAKALRDVPTGALFPFRKDL